jgi:hypothetical protein
MKRSKISTGILYWVTVRNEDTGELLNTWQFTDLGRAEIKKIEQDEALDPPGIQTDVQIETLPAGLSPSRLKRR